jgi:hypothetical protein
MKTVQLLTDNAKALYFDPERAALRPNLVFVRSDGSIAFEINELGLKGDPLDPDRKLAVVWGDSVVFSHGRGWPCLIDRLAPGWQFLNGGVEGDPYKNILRRASDLNGRHPVSLNLLMLGWHSFVPSWWAENSNSNAITAARTKPGRSRNGNEDLHAELTSFLRRVPNTVVLTIPTALNRHIVDHPLSPYLREGDHDSGFHFFGDFAREVEGQCEAFAYILERNAIARRVCSELGIRVVDLFAAFDTERVSDFREHFSEVLHLRPRSYPLVAQHVYAGIKDLLA